MSTTWLRFRSALAFSFFLPWFPIVWSSPPENEPLVVGVAEATGPAEPGAALPSPEDPLVLPGVVIEEIPKGSALEKAGLQVGDVILGWERLANPPANPEGASGRIESPFDWMWLEIEQAPRGVVKLTGEREGGEISWEVGSGAWESRAVPNFADRHFAFVLTEVIAGRQGISVSEVNRAGSQVQFPPATSSDTSCWLAFRLGVQQPGRVSAIVGQILQQVESERSGAAGDAKLPRCILQAVLASIRPELNHAPCKESQSDRSPSPACRFYTARLLDFLGTAAYERGDLDEAQRFFLALLDFDQSNRQAPLITAQDLNNLGAVSLQRGHLDSALTYLSESLDLRSRNSPGVLGEADSLNNVANVLLLRGDHAGAEDNLRRAIDIYSKLGISNSSSANILSTYGVLLEQRGKLDDAKAVMERAVALWAQFPEAETSHAAALTNLSGILLQYGYIDDAEEMLRKALAILEKASADSVPVAHVMKRLGALLLDRYEWGGAEMFLRRALDIYSANRVEANYLGDCLNTLGTLRLERGDAAGALSIFEKVVQLYGRLSVQSLDLSAALANLARAERQLGKLDLARSHLLQVISIESKLAPAGLKIAQSFHELGDIEELQGDFSAAAEQFGKALEIKARLAPGTETEARTWSRIGLLRRKLGDLAGAEQALSMSVESLGVQGARLDSKVGSQESFRSQNSLTFRALISVQIARHLFENAFLSSEGFRGTVMTARLSERKLSFPEVSSNLQVARDSLAVQYDRNIVEQERLCNLAEQPLCEKLRQEAASLRDQLSLRLAELRRSSPRLAALQYPQPLGVLATRSALDKGIIMLSYIIGESESYLFSVGRDDDLRVRTLPIGETELRRWIQKFRGLIAEARPGTMLAELRAAERYRVSKDLYDLLVAPAADRIEKANRVLIVADGPLHYLPFAALLREVPGKGGHLQGQYLAEWKPFHSMLSATVYAEIKKDRRDPSKAPESSPLLLGAFGDPRLPPGFPGKTPEQITDIRVRSAVRRGILKFEPLPSTRREVEGIAALFPPEQVAIFLGAEATEERAKAIGKGARILHFATHARLDELFPLNSALVLTMPEGFPEDRDNGLLQVWEIFERVRLDADLVVLSACDTGLGEEQGGEGLIGLTRAFQYAGARTVMASLWSVQDQATSELMIRFYKHLRAGLSKDEALRQAQIELIRGPIEIVNENGGKALLDASAPYFWAGFQVYGDWQ